MDYIPTLKLINYPAELAVMVGEKFEDYSNIREKFGRYAVMLLRDEKTIRAILTDTSIVKIGNMICYIKVISPHMVAQYLSHEDYEMIKNCDEILVCAPPFNAEKAMVISNIAVENGRFYATKYKLLESLDMVLAIDSSIVDNIVRDINHHIKDSINPFNKFRDGISYDDFKILTSSNINNYILCNICNYPPINALDEEEIYAFSKIIDLLSSCKNKGLANKLNNNALRSPQFAYSYHYPHFIEGFRENINELLTYIYYEEVTSFINSPNKKITIDDRFVLIFNDIITMNMTNSVHSEDEAITRLNIFIGGYLKDLDLSNTLITGSALTASIIMTPDEKKYYNFGETGYETYIGAHYPNIITIPRDEQDTYIYETITDIIKKNPEEVALRFVTTIDENTKTVDIRLIATQETHYSETKEYVCDFDVIKVADVNFYIDVETDEQFDQVVLEHYKIINKHYPDAILTKSSNEWSITDFGNLYFRDVTLSRGTFNDVARHPISATCAAYTGKQPQFIMTSRFARTMLLYYIYYYPCEDVEFLMTAICKYQRRGFCSENFLLNRMDDFIQFPALFRKDYFNVNNIDKEGIIFNRKA